MNGDQQRVEYEKFVGNVVNFLTMYPGANVMVIVETQQGPRMLSNNTPFWQLGAARWAYRFIQNLLKVADPIRQAVPQDGGKEGMTQ